MVPGPRSVLAYVAASLMMAVASPTPAIAGLSNELVSYVRTNTLQSANSSWELGTAAEAFLEFSWPSLSVFSRAAFPPPTRLNSTLNASDVLQIAYETLQAKPYNSMALVANDEAVGDPASIGIAVLLANWTRPDLEDGNLSYAAGQQLAYLLGYAPRTPEGAISQRTDQVQLWADFIYMGPPFIAYFGITQGGKGELPLLQAAYDQCRLYRDQLYDEDASLWRHIALGNWQDNNHWATGNGWAAAGMLRVAVTMNNSMYADQLVEQSANLTSWINEILDGVWANQQQNGTLLNVLDDPDSFAESASTALLASVTFRMAALTSDDTYIDSANKALALVTDSLDLDGWLHNTVNPYTFLTPTDDGAHSPEGQAFVLLMHAAWRDYVQFVENSDS